MKTLCFLSFIFSSVALASTVAIIDSGVDFRHQKLQKNIWVNPGEIAGNYRDEDGNGYEDDVYGWNFAENNNQVIDYSYLGTFSPDMKKFFVIQTKMMFGTASTAEVAWLRASIEDQEFIKELSKFGNFIHGTHVAGIAALPSDSNKILAVKLIPTEVKLPGFVNEKAGIRMNILKKGLGALAGQQIKMLTEIGFYVGDLKADVANGSFGTGFKQASMIVQLIFKPLFQREPTEEELFELANSFLQELVTNGREFVGAAPETLFVFAAGNDGSDNDKYLTFPSNIKTDNSISVAATMGASQIAGFSNFGGKSVDVAAPGVGIESTIPGDDFLTVSGTSQAAPFVARVAGKIKSINKQLSPLEIKEIIESTVDKKDFLTGKVRTAGIVNDERAFIAAQYSAVMNLSDAIYLANSQIADKKYLEFKKLNKENSELVNQSVLPLPANFIY